MPWYHISPEPNLRPTISELRQPENAHGEIRQRCFCLAPTVWQCIVSVSQDHYRYIYEVHVHDPEPAHHSINDSSITCEHRITERVLAANSGSFAVSYSGEFVLDPQLIAYLKSAFIHTGLTCDADQERDHLWRVHDGRWSLRHASLEDLAVALGVEHLQARRPTSSCS